jgi:hypothetical protein
MCEACFLRPSFHSFERVGETQDGISIFYSKPSLNVETQFREEAIPMYIAHMDEASVKPWIWIFDAAGLDKLEIPNPFLMRRFYKLVSQRYVSVLQRIVLFHCNWKVRFLLSLIQPFVSREARERIVEVSSPLELATLGIDMELLQTLCRKLE